MVRAASGRDAIDGRETACTASQPFADKGLNIRATHRQASSRLAHADPPRHQRPLVATTMAARVPKPNLAAEHKVN